MPITTGQRIFFGVICAAALLVAVLGLFVPTELAAIFTWLVLPPLHAHFVGAIYAFGAVFMLGCLLARTQAEVRGAVQMIGIWTGMLFIISLLNLRVFDFQRTPVWIWFASYITYPLIAIAMTWRERSAPHADTLRDAPLPAWAKSFLLSQGIVVTLLAVLLFFLPDFMTTLWPWKVTPVLAQMYAGPLLSYGLGSLLFARRATWLGVRAIVPAMLVFTAATVIVSVLHVDLFSFGELPDLLWFAAFGLATIVLAVMSVRALRAGPSAP